MPMRSWLTLIGIALLLGAARLAMLGRDTGAWESPAPAGSPWAAIAKGRVDIEGGLIHLAASRDGLITRVFVEEGAQVQPGQPLAALDDRPARLALDAAERESTREAALLPILGLKAEAARREEARLTGLVPLEGASPQELDLARDARRVAEAKAEAQRAALEAARARAAQARWEVAQRVVRAPLAGTIVRRQARPGDGVSTLNVTPLFVFAPDQPRIVRADLDEASLPQVRAGQRAEILLEADESRRAKGRVLRIGRVVGARSTPPDPAERADTRVVECVLSLEGADFLLGQRVLVRFPAGRP